MPSATVRGVPLTCSPVKLLKSIFFKWLKASGNSLKVKQTLRNIYKTSVGKARVSHIWTKTSLFFPALSQLWGSETPHQTLAAKNAWLPLTEELRERLLPYRKSTSVFLIVLRLSPRQAHLEVEAPFLSAPLVELRHYLDYAMLRIPGC